MEQINQRIVLLENRMAELIKDQERQNAAILSLLAELHQLRAMLPLEEAVEETVAEAATETIHPPVPPPVKHPLPPFIPPRKSGRLFGANRSESGMEDLIGRNLINRLGILLLAVGVFIGAKYAIDNELISPFTRILLGYLMSGALAVVAIRLKRVYPDYSAVVMSGAVAIFYFITYIGFSFYHLFPQLLAFVLMFVATGFSVGTAIWYNNRFIALMGQVGAYGIPFLLSSGSGNVMFLLGYTCLVNLGLLILSYLKDWRQIYQIAFYSSWLVFVVSDPWQSPAYTPELKLTLLTLQMLIFYGAFLSYKLLRNEGYRLPEVAVLLINAIGYYLLGRLVLTSFFRVPEVPVTLFTLSNALLHFLLGRWMMRRSVADKSLHLFLLGLGISFLTAAVPVAFKGNTITIFWVIEALVLAFIGYRIRRGVYLTLSTVLVGLTLISLAMDWNNAENRFYGAFFDPFLNQNFISSFFAIAAIGVMAYLAQRNADQWEGQKDDFVPAALPLLFIVLGFILLWQEVDFLWRKHIADTAFYAFKGPVLQLLAAVYLAVWMTLNQVKYKHKGLAAIFLVATIYLTGGILLGGLDSLGDIRDLYLKQQLGNSAAMLGFRYVLFAGLGTILYLMHLNLTIAAVEKKLEKGFYLGVLLAGLTVVCNEFVHWMDVAGRQGQYKLGLSIISALYALSVLTFGILKRRQYLRLGAMVLLAITLLKVFLYDLSALSTISKTLVFILLGLVLLVASFLYTKYKDSLFPKEETTEVG